MDRKEAERKVLEDMIQQYIPSPRDETLERGVEYYYLQWTNRGDRVIRVEVRSVWPREDGDEYAIYQRRGPYLTHVDVGYENQLRGAKKRALYDNKTDCRMQTHWGYDGWEKLREAEDVWTVEKIRG